MDREPPDPCHYNKWENAGRRQFIRDYLDYYGQEIAKWNTALEEAYEATMSALDPDIKQVSDKWLKFVADRAAWKIFYGHGSRSSKPSDISEGVSPKYQKWRLDHQLPVEEYYEGPGGTRQGKILSLQQRQMFSQDLCFHLTRESQAPINVPFEISIPSWLGVESLVFGDDGSLFDTINDQIVPPFLALSWHCKSDDHFTLVVGINPTSCVVTRNDEVQGSLHMLWLQVVEWVTMTFDAGTMSLATFLRANKVMNRPCRQEEVVIFAARAQYKTINDDPLAARVRIRDSRQFMAQC
ncbi:hypothetical protein F53441_10106 [Fusarium austroafricanum]|uniref:Uncharacterized protein n=1 Tax=Fusarium austroafricanum TaxID=2364996 RepID=A0A8H4NVQ9_9HYPO|nr:hypothetical protein F53441_10106 [Fusarium austroafricanum]